MNSVFRLMSVGLILLGLTGCAAKWTDGDGVQHVFGFADISIYPADGKRLAGDIVEVSTIGASIFSDDRTASFNIGYNHTTTAAFNDNSLTRGPFDKISDSAAKTSDERRGQ